MTIQNFGKAVLLASTLFAASSQASVAHFTLDATPGDYISGGQAVDNLYLSSNPLLEWNWANFHNVGTPDAPAADSVSFTYLLSLAAGPDDQFAQLTFATATGQGAALEAGKTYTNAERAPFASFGHPGLEVNYDHRGCNTLTGDFTVNKLSFQNGELGEFGASFNQSCDGGALMHGSFYYNASLDALPPSDVPEPATLALLGLGVAGAAAARRRN